MSCKPPSREVWRLRGDVARLGMGNNGGAVGPSVSSFGCVRLSSFSCSIRHRDGTLCDYRTIIIYTVYICIYFFTIHYFAKLS